MKVKATQVGFHNNATIEAGQVFDISDEMFTEAWMVKVDEAGKPEDGPKPVENVQELTPENGDVHVEVEEDEKKTRNKRKGGR